jgi:putative phosphoesterase
VAGSKNQPQKMKRIGLISDTHSHLDPTIFEHFAEVDEIWHAGDIGSVNLYDQLNHFKPTKAVFGNIDDHLIRRICPKDLIFDTEGLKVVITHIGGFPPRYNQDAKQLINREKPGLVITGHCHILRIMPDPTHNLLFINPGAAGHHGFHLIRTVVRFGISEGKVKDLQVIELGRRGSLTT